MKPPKKRQQAPVDTVALKKAIATDDAKADLTF